MPKKRRARCEAVADALDLPRPFDLDVLCERIAAQRGRPLRLVPLEGKPDASLPCGVWVATRTSDLIFYEPATSALHKLQIVLHELAHLLLGHGGPDAERPAYAARLLDGTSWGCRARDGEPAAPGERTSPARGEDQRADDAGSGGAGTGAGVPRGAPPDARSPEAAEEIRRAVDAEEELDLDQLLHVLGRTSYSDDQEREAEFLATLLSQRALDEEPPARAERAAGVLDRLNDAFGHPVRRNP